MNEELSRKLISIRRDIHRNPELGDKEYRTTGLIERILKQNNIKTQRLTPTGVVGILDCSRAGAGNKTGKRCIALRADIDALPVDEMTRKPFSSRNKGVMHACGHDAHTTMLLGAGMLLSEYRNKIDGIIKFIFQPNEETVSGARKLIEKNVLKKPDVGMIVGLHVSPELPSAVLGLKYGKMMAAVDKFEIVISGGGGHAAYPHRGKDAILCASEFIQSVQSIVSREIDPTEPAVISVTTIHAGNRFNILADSVVISGTVRTVDKEVHRKIPVLIRRHLSSIAKRHNLKFDLKYDIIGQPLINSDSAVDMCKAALCRSAKLRILSNPSMGGEDFADYLEHVPGCFLYIGVKRSAGTGYPLHHPKFDIDEKVLAAGSDYFTKIALYYLR